MSDTRGLTQGLSEGDNPIADAMAKRHVELLMKTGMAYEFSPETIATRAFLDGFAAICGVLDEVKAGRDAVEAELKITKEERDNYAHWLNESGQANYTNIQKVLELEWELNYAAHCVTRVEELSKKLLALRRELERVSKRGQNRDAENAALRAEIKAYRDAVDAQPWATDEPIRVLLDRITAALVSLRKDRERLRSGKIRLMTQNATTGAWEPVVFKDVDLYEAIDAAMKGAANV